MPSILEVDQLSCRFGGLVAVDAVSLAVAQGEIFGLIGPNGAGKTTLFNVISGLVDASGGRVIYRGRNITKFPPHRIASLGIARTFQNLRLFQELSVLENVAIARHLHNPASLWSGIFGLAAAQEQATYKKARELLELFHLDQQRHRPAQDLAYGDQRRLEIARALAIEPRLLLLDEPAAGMNPTEKQALSQLIRQIHDQFDLTIVLIEHHVPLVMGLCDRIAVLNFGQLIALDSPARIQASQAVIEAYLGNA